MTELPRKKVWSSLILAVIIILGAVWYKYSDRGPYTYEQRQLKAVTRSILEKDSDGDGLKDWEEALWGTDINKTDTDGDGTSDNEETRSNRNPTKAGPDDQIDIDSVLNKKDSPTIELSETDKFARDLFARYFAVKKQGGTVSAENQEILVENLLNDYSLPKGKKHQLSEIKTFNQAGSEIIRDYGNALGSAIIANTPEIVENELALFEEAVTSNKPELLPRLDPIIKRYSGTAKDALAIVSPADASELQLQFINRLEELASAVSSMKMAFSDPLSTVIATRAYVESINGLVEVLSEYRIYFSLRGIVFKPNDPAYSLVGNSTN